MCRRGLDVPVERTRYPDRKAPNVGRPSIVDIRPAAAAASTEFVLTQAWRVVDGLARPVTRSRGGRSAVHKAPVNIPHRIRCQEGTTDMADHDSRLPASGSLVPTQQPAQPATAREAAVDAAGDVVQTAKEQGQEVMAETGRQAQQVYAQVRSEVDAQARAQQQRAASGLYAIADEAGRIAERGGESGVATQLNRQAAQRVREVGQWLEQREPRQVLNEIKTYARRHPGTFLAGAALLGVVAGRLTKNLAAAGGAAGPGSRIDPAPRAPFATQAGTSPLGAFPGDGKPAEAHRVAGFQP